MMITVNLMNLKVFYRQKRTMIIIKKNSLLIFFLVFIQVAFLFSSSAFPFHLHHPPPQLLHPKMPLRNLSVRSLLLEPSSTSLIRPPTAFRCSLKGPSLPSPLLLHRSIPRS